jgi:NAD(P)-dependent dehydrogenase (short-subunit alcohol dehydrogenase family)
MRPLSSQTVLVTGATGGLGRALAGELAREGATVLLHGRDESRLATTLAKIRAESGNDRLRPYRADLASLRGVRDLAARVLEAEPRLDVLVNNAGVGTTIGGDGGRNESADGYELRLAVNYLAPFLLTRRVLPLLVGSAPARIVNVASAGQAALDFDDLMIERGYTGTLAYCRSKLALVAFTFDLADELRDRAVTANCLHPATYMPTTMVLDAGVQPVDTLESGVRTTRRLVADPALDGVTGRYFNRFEEARAQRQAYDPEARRRLREVTERLVGEQRPPG